MTFDGTSSPPSFTHYGILDDLEGESSGSIIKKHLKMPCYSIIYHLMYKISSKILLILILGDKYTEIFS